MFIKISNNDLQPYVKSRNSNSHIRGFSQVTYRKFHLTREFDWSLLGQLCQVISIGDA